MRKLKLRICTLSLTSVLVCSASGCVDSGNRVVKETGDYSFEKMSELAKQDLERSESLESEEKYED